MVKRTIEAYECDVCAREAVRYTLSFPEGVKTLDRCDRHDKAIHKLREEKGSWATLTGHRSPFKVSSPDDISKQRKENS